MLIQLRMIRSSMTPYPSRLSNKQGQRPIFKIKILESYRADAYNYIYTYCICTAVGTNKGLLDT